MIARIHYHLPGADKPYVVELDDDGDWASEDDPRTAGVLDVIANSRIDANGESTHHAEGRFGTLAVRAAAKHLPDSRIEWGPAPIYRTDVEY
jgi:hypothetical protein